jgi:hypothetical protein
MDRLTLTQFVQSLNTRRGHCRHLLELSRRQPGLIADGRYPELVDVLHQKQHVLERLAELSHAGADGAESWRAGRSAVPADLRDRIEALIDEVEHLLGDVASEEEQSVGQLRQRRDETASELRTISEGTQAQRAYIDSFAPARHHRLDVAH